ncbi:T6SS immunity protein Tli4 family protein [Massilia timonae]|uniref:T6SS immunity protein Tli4 family protein n=1 Tax=Massilia timonae TaxID=47229 RepID=UPI0028A1E4F6|nr:T6SS immunity protein Tli4 family protein [Massilia timonae]
MRYLQKRWTRAWAVVLAALTGTWAVGAVLDRYEVAKMTEKMQTVCVGRMLIDLPAEAQYSFFGEKISGFSIGASEESAEAFTARLAQREAAIRTKPDRLGGDNNLEIARDVKTDSGLVGKIFMHERTVTEGTQLNGMKREPYRIEDVTLEAHVHGDGVGIDVIAKEASPQRIETLFKLVSQLVANPANSIPTESGFCLDRAYVRDPLTAKNRERIVMTAGLPSRPDIEIKFDTTAGTKPGKGLLERAAASHARAPLIVSARFTKLRAAPRTIGGLTGDELVEQVLEENFSIIYGFRWEVDGSEDNVFVPDVRLMMKTGSGDDGPVPSSLSQPAALALWDRIISSIRIRPTQPPRAAAADVT